MAAISPPSVCVASIIKECRLSPVAPKVIIGILSSVPAYGI